MTIIDARKTVKINDTTYSIPADAEIVQRGDLDRWGRPIALVAEDLVDGLPSALIAPRSAMPSGMNSRIVSVIAELGARFPEIGAGELARLALGNAPRSRYDSDPLSEICASGALRDRGIGNTLYVYEAISEDDAPDDWPITIIETNEN